MIVMKLTARFAWLAVHAGVDIGALSKNNNY
jgi:hypothetical protein